MKFMRLTQMEMKYGRDAEGKSTREWSAKGPVLVNVALITYMEPLASNPQFSCITFMDHEESSCCVTVKEPFEDIERRLREYV